MPITNRITNRVQISSPLDGSGFAEAALPHALELAAPGSIIATLRSCNELFRRPDERRRVSPESANFF